MKNEDPIALAQARYAQTCDKFHKQTLATTGEIIPMVGLKVVALFRGDKLTAAYRLSDGTAVDLDGPDLIRLHRLLARRRAQTEGKP
jgi:hypothetical protein